MFTKVDVSYRADEDRYRAEFVRGGKVVDYKYLTNEEHEALSAVYHLPQESAVTSMNGEALLEYLGVEIDLEPDSNFSLMLFDLMGVKN